MVLNESARAVSVSSFLSYDTNSNFSFSHKNHRAENSSQKHLNSIHHRPHNLKRVWKTRETFHHAMSSLAEQPPQAAAQEGAVDTTITTAADAAEKNKNDDDVEMKEANDNIITTTAPAAPPSAAAAEIDDGAAADEEEEDAGGEKNEQEEQEEEKEKEQEEEEEREKYDPKEEKPHKERKTPASIFSNTGVYSVPGKVRWQPTTAQFERLEQLFAIDTTTPQRENLKQVTEELSALGPIQECNVYNWFQNKKARLKKREQDAARERMEEEMRAKADQYNAQQQQMGNLS
ncbi:unnamed protein product [Bathycoccus prasinos]